MATTKQRAWVIASRLEELARRYQHLPDAERRAILARERRKYFEPKKPESVKP